jgi:hypothetical protein
MISSRTHKSLNMAAHKINRPPRKRGREYGDAKR